VRACAPLQIGAVKGLSARRKQNRLGSQRAFDY
jgi:hypothetical protein